MNLIERKFWKEKDHLCYKVFIKASCQEQLMEYFKEAIGKMERNIEKYEKKMESGYEVNLAIKDPGAGVFVCTTGLAL